MVINESAIPFVIVAARCPCYLDPLLALNSVRRLRACCHHMTFFSAVADVGAQSVLWREGTAGRLHVQGKCHCQRPCYSFTCFTGRFYHGVQSGSLIWLTFLSMTATKDSSELPYMKHQSVCRMKYLSVEIRFWSENGVYCVAHVQQMLLILVAALVSGVLSSNMN